MFRAIWIIQPGFPSSGKEDTIIHFIGYNPDAYYWKFMKAQSKKYKAVKAYMKSVEYSGDVGPTLVVGFPLTHENYDFSVDRNRLMFAIHFMTASYKQYNKKIYL